MIQSYIIKYFPEDHYFTQYLVFCIIFQYKSPLMYLMILVFEADACASGPSEVSKTTLSCKKDSEKAELFLLLRHEF